MNLNDYFEQRKEHILGQDQKLAIYNQFIAKRNRLTKAPSISKKMHTFRYIFSMTVVFVLAFGSYYTVNPNLLMDMFFAWDNVNALNIAKIINSNWSFSITSNSDSSKREVQWNNVNDWDMINVDKWSSVFMQISKSHNAKLNWPAKLQVIYDWENSDGTSEYRLKIIEWDYLSVESTSDQSAENVSVETEDWLVINNIEDSVKPTIKKKTSFVVEKKNNVNIVDNNSNNEITVSHKDKKAATVVIQDNKVAAINSSDSVWTKINLLVADTKELLDIEIDRSNLTTLTTWTTNTWVITTGLVVTGAAVTGQITTWTSINNSWDNQTWTVVSWSISTWTQWTWESLWVSTTWSTKTLEVEIKDAEAILHPASGVITESVESTVVSESAINTTNTIEASYKLDI